MCFEKIVAQLKKELSASVSKEERERAFQALSGAVITMLLVLYQSYSEISAQAILSLFTLCTFIIASRFLFKNEKDIQRIELYGAYWSFLTVVFMLFGATLMYLGHEVVWNNTQLKSIGTNILMSYSVLAMFLLVLFASFAAGMWIRELFTKPKKQDEKKETQKNTGKKVPTTSPMKKDTSFISLNGWFIFALVLFVALWWQFLHFFPFNEVPPQESLPSKKFQLSLENNEKIVISCLNGHVFETQVVQGDLLDCLVREENLNMSAISDGGIGIYIVSAMNVKNKTIGEVIPEEEYQRNGDLYKATVYPSDFENNVATFRIKVPPTRFFTFYVEIKGYYSRPYPLEYGIATTKFDEYLRNSLPPVQLLLLMFGVFGAVKYARDLAESR